MTSNAKTLLQQFIKYGLIGSICTVVDFALLYALTTFFKLNYLQSGVISFLTGSTLNYFLSTLFVFRERPITNKKIEFTAYIVVSTIGMGINILFLYLLTEYMHFFYLLSKLIGTAFTFAWNFWSRRQLIHSTRFITLISNKKDNIHK